MLNKLLGIFRSDTSQPTVNLVAERFLQLFHDHGLVDSQIPLLLPEVKLSDLKSPDTLLNVLNHELLTKAANLFGVRTEWLQGVDEYVYDSKCSCYKYPDEFFKYISQLPKPDSLSPIKVLTDNKNLDYKSPYNSEIVLIYVEKIAKLGDQVVNRYHVLDGSWNWHHPLCRIQLKAMARLLFRKYRYVISIYQIDAKNLEDISESRAIPAPFMDTRISTEPSLEDYGIGADEFGVSKESEELEAVLAYIEEHRLEALVDELKAEKKEKPQNTPKNSKMSSREKASAAGIKKNQKLNELKKSFLDQYSDAIKTKSISAAKASRQFYDKLSEDQEKLLFRSIKDYENTSPDERRMKAERTLTAAFRIYNK